MFSWISIDEKIDNYIQEQIEQFIKNVREENANDE